MLLIYLIRNSARCDYVFDLIFKHELGISYRLTSDAEEFQRYPEEKISYGEWRMGDGFFIKASPLLFESEIKDHSIGVVEKHQTKVLFPDEEDDLGFDIFSAVFFMVSRYEEYLPFTPDDYGRFKAGDSVAGKNNFLQKPVVNIWINILKEALKKKFPSITTAPGAFNAIFTYDIDLAYKYKGRSIARIIGASLMDLANFRFINIIDRKLVLLKFRKDPWDVYDGLKEKMLKNQLNSIFFFLLADKTKFDRNLSCNNSLVQALIRGIGAYSNIGIHPSFYSSEFPQKILQEKDRLEHISGEKILKSRQHFLRFNLPATFHSLLEAGIVEDYSMGFPGSTGFRAGTCKPFYFYDLKSDKITSLKIFPITCMDATFVYYTKQSPEKALMEILNLLKEIKKVNGTFIPIFHNDHLMENQKWTMVHDKIIMQVKSYLKK